MAYSGEDVEQVCEAPPLDHVVEPVPAWADPYAENLARFRTLYARLSQAGDAEEVQA